MVYKEGMTETLSIPQMETSVLAILENPGESLETKAAIFEGILEVPITRKRDYLRRWSVFTGRESLGGLDPDQMEKIVEKFRTFHNFRDKHEGEKAGHNTFTNFYYSDYFLPALVSIRNYAETHRDVQALRQSSLALLVLNDTLDILQTTNPQTLREFDKQNLLTIEQAGSTATILEPFDNHIPVDLAEVFPRLHLNSSFGRNTDRQGFDSLMAMARLTAYQCIAANCQKSIYLDTKTKLPKTMETKDFATLCKKAQQHFLELGYGVIFPPDTLVRIKDSKALVVSIDWNSVWNTKESFANTHMISTTVEAIRVLSQDFHKKFPDKKILFVMNTGRPADYAWGVIEAISVVEELRVIGLAESGGAILKSGMNKGEIDVPVPDSKEWENQLEALRHHLLSKIKNGKNKVKVEPKHSMVSIRLVAEEADSDTHWRHKDNQGHPVTPEWISAEVSAYLSAKQGDLSKEKSDLEIALSTDDQLKFKAITPLRRLREGGDALSNEDLEKIKEEFEEVGEGRGVKLTEITSGLRTASLMAEKLTAVYNSRARYVDIGHRDLNKYSTLISQMEKQFGFRHNEVVVITIGDSQPDIIPENETADNQPNRGADEVISVAVGNATPVLRDAVEKRRQRNNRGIQTVTESILGLISIIQGLDRLITSGK